MSFRVWIVISILSLLQGCVSSFQLNNEESAHSTLVQTTYASSPLFQFEWPYKPYYIVGEELLTFENQVILQLLAQGRYYASLKEPYRLKACKELAEVYKKDLFWQTGWLLAYSFSDKGSCITHKERLVILNELKDSIDIYKNIQWLNALQIQTLEHITHLKIRNTLLKTKENTLKVQLDASKAENLELKALIKELKKVEKIMNERLSDESH